jgi:hypothetical protein
MVEDDSSDALVVVDEEKQQEERRRAKQEDQDRELEGINPAVAALVPLLQDKFRNKDLVVLDLYKRGLNDDDIEALCRGLEDNISVKELLLGNPVCTIKKTRLTARGFNAVGDRGAKALASLLTTNRHLQTLSLVNNAIRNEGAKALAETLSSKGCRLHTLYLGFNMIGDEGGIALARAIHFNFALHILSLWHNVLGDDAGEEVLTMLQINSTIGKCDVRDNKMSQEVLDKIAACATLPLKERVVGRDELVATERQRQEAEKERLKWETIVMKQVQYSTHCTHYAHALCSCTLLMHSAHALCSCTLLMHYADAIETQSGHPASGKQQRHLH